MREFESSVSVRGNKVYIFDTTKDITFTRYALEVEEGGVLTPQGTANLILNSCGLQVLEPDDTLDTEANIYFSKELTPLLHDFLTNLPTTDLDVLGILFQILSNTNRLPNPMEIAFAISDVSGTIDNYRMFKIHGDLSQIIQLNAAINYCVSTFNTHARLRDLGDVNLEPYASEMSWYITYATNIFIGVVYNTMDDFGNLGKVPLYTLDLLSKCAYNTNSVNTINLEKLIDTPLEGELLSALHRQDVLNDFEKEELTYTLLKTGYLFGSLG